MWSLTVGHTDIYIQYYMHAVFIYINMENIEKG